MESYVQQSVKQKHITNGSKICKPLTKKVKNTQSQSIYRNHLPDNKSKNILDKMSTSQQISQNLITNINLDDEQTSEEDFESSESNKNALRRPEILRSTIQYITSKPESDNDEEIDVVNIDEYPKSPKTVVLDVNLAVKKSKIENKACSKGSSPVSKTKNKTVKPVSTLAEGMQILFSSINKRSTNSSTSNQITSDVEELKSIENVLNNRVKNHKSVDALDNVSNQKSYFKTCTALLNNKLDNCNSIYKEKKIVINVKGNNDSDQSNTDTLVKTVNDEEFSKLITVQVILNRNVVDNYFKSKQLISKRGISDSSKANKIFNNASEVNTSQKPNNKKSLKQTTMLQFFNIKPIKESKSLHTTTITTNVIGNNENSPNKAVDNRKTMIKEITSRVGKTPVTTKPKKSFHAIENSRFGSLNNSSPEITETPNLNTFKSTKKPTFLHCNDCNYKTNRGKASILEHIQSKHTDGFINDIEKCQQCGTKFKYKTSLKSHQAACGLIPHFMCPFCPLRSKYDRNIRKHLLKQHKSKFKSNELDDIFHKIVNKGKAFKAKALKLALEGKEIPRVMQKEKTTMKNKIDLYCTDCNQSFVRDHKKKNNRMKMCPNCNKLLQCQCVKCKKVLKSYESCWQHITSVCERKEWKVLHCNDCSFTADIKSILITHIQRVHTEIDPKDYVKCPNCSKGFKNRAYMKYHEKTCGKSKDYQCEFCSYKTKYIYQMNKHIKKHAMHSKDKNVVFDVNRNSERNASCEIINSSKIIESNKSKLKMQSNDKYKKVQVIAPNSIEQENLQEKTLKTLNLATYVCLKCKAIDPSTTVRVIDCTNCQVQMRYCCKSCKRIYSNWGNFCHHLLQKCATPHNYQCEHCDRQFTIKDNVRRHIFAEHMTEVDTNGYVKCPKCKNKYKGRANMLKHKRLCGRVERHFKCKFCNIKSNYKHNLRKHMLQQHDNLSRMEVENALNEIVGKANEKNKETKKNKVSKTKNNTSTKVRKNNLRLVPTNQSGFHIISLQMNKKEILDTQHLIQVKCPGCSKSYTVDKKKKSHNLIRCFHCQTNNIFMCIQCSKEYSRVRHVRRHLKRDHLLDPDHRLLHECSNCEKRFTFYENLKRHWHLCFKTDNLTCDYCGFTTKYKGSLLNHIRRKHLGNNMKKNHECVKCGFKFLEEEQLQKHMRSCIGGCECDECGAKFRTKLELINHIQSKNIN